MPRLPDLPDLDWKPDGTPVARAFDDVYFSLSDGLEETRNVFLKACGLPERWKDRASFTIAELGFGSGLNFLGALECWCRSERAANGWLHFLSVEKYLMSASEAARVVGRWDALAEFRNALIARWPVRAKGLQRIEFPEFRATLTLYVGDAQDWLSSCEFMADAWFLDGFAPAKNDEMWGPDIYRLMESHSLPGALVGTYTVAGAVRRGLADAGYRVSKQAGFGRKRERLEAIWPDVSETRNVSDPFLSSPRCKKVSQIVIVGAGIAGACLALAFRRLGMSVTVLDAGDGPASGASGNPLGLIMPRLDAADTPQARFLLQSYLYALKFYEGAETSACTRLDVEQSPQSDTEIRRFAKLAADPPLDADWLGFSDGKLIHRHAMLVEPARLVADLMSLSGADLQYGCDVTDFASLKAGHDDETVFVFASAMAIKSQLEQMSLPLIAKMGQVDWVEHASSQTAGRASGSYALRHDRRLLCGATFEALADDELPFISEGARTENLRNLTELAPDWAGEVSGSSWQSRAAVRTTTPDRMPVAGVTFDHDVLCSEIAPLSKGQIVDGPISHDPSCFVLTGLGARGFTFAPCLADLIACHVTGRPLPLARPELEQVSPARFAIRAVKRGT